MIKTFEWFQKRLGQKPYFTDLVRWEPPSKIIIKRGEAFGGTSLEFRWASENFRCPHCAHQGDVCALIKFIFWENEDIPPNTFIEAIHGHNEVIEGHCFQSLTLPDEFVSFMSIFFRKKEDE